jgi:hypothetical protein
MQIRYLPEKLTVEKCHVQFLTKFIKFAEI